MTSRSRIITRWTSPRNLASIILFVIFVIALESVIVSYANSASSDATLIILPITNISISALYHLIPSAVILILIMSFAHLMIHTSRVPQKSSALGRSTTRRTRRRPGQLRSIRRVYRRLSDSTQKIIDRIANFPAIAKFTRTFNSVKPRLRAATIVAVIFGVMVILLAAAAYPTAVPASAGSFLRGNTALFGFIMATIRAAEGFARVVSPIGAIGAALHSGLVTAAPPFHNALETLGSSIGSGLVALNPDEKYLVIQNAAAWTSAIVAIIYSHYFRRGNSRR